VPCSDNWAKAIAELPDELKRRFPASCASASAIRTLVDKWRFAQMLECSGLPHPRTALIRSMEELERLPASAFESRFLKPCASQEFGARHKVKAFLIENKADALSIMAKTREQGWDEFPIMLQEYIAGPPSSHYFVDGYVDGSGTVAALFARRRLRMFPPSLGNSTLMESIPLDEVSGAIATIERIVSVLRYRGIFSAEFKRDSRDGLFKIIEVNARPWWFIEFAARCGVDVCGLLYRDALGQALKPIKNYRTGRRCVLVPSDWKAFRANRNGDSIFSWLRECARAEKAVFAWDDPGPSFVYLSAFLRKCLRKRILH
jgi:D-aspartate ligase